jgi:hypothetical protein
MTKNIFPPFEGLKIRKMKKERFDIKLFSSITLYHIFCGQDSIDIQDSSSYTLPIKRNFLKIKREKMEEKKFVRLTETVQSAG